MIVGELFVMESVKGYHSGLNSNALGLNVSPVTGRTRGYLKHPGHHYS